MACYIIIGSSDFPGVPVVKCLPSNTRDVGSIPIWGSKIPHPAGQLSLHVPTKTPCSKKRFFFFNF